MKRLRKMVLTLGMVALMVTGCGSTTTQTSATADVDTLENTTVVIGRLIEVAGNQITVQIGEMASTSQGMGGGMGMMQGEMTDEMTGEMPTGEMPEGMQERSETGEMPEGMTERGGGTGEMTGEMPEGMTGRGGGTGEMTGEMPEGMSERGQMGGGQMGGQMPTETTSDMATAPTTESTATSNVPTNTTETQTTQAPTTGEMSGEMPDRTSGEMPEGMTGRGGEMSGGGMGEMSGGMGEMGGMTSGSSSTSYSSVDELKDALISSVYSDVILSDVYEVYTIPVGTPIDQYGVETTFLQLTEKSYVSIVFNESGTIVSMEVLGG